MWISSMFLVFWSLWQKCYLKALLNVSIYDFPPHYLHPFCLLLSAMVRLNLSVTSFCSDLDPALQHELRQYLAARGIEENFTNSLLLHLHKKEQGQYMGWLQKLKDMMVEHEWFTQMAQPHLTFKISNGVLTPSPLMS